MEWFIHVVVGMAVIVHIKKQSTSYEFLYDTLPEFEFFKDDGSELFHDAWPNVSGQSSYWSDQIKIVVWY